VDTRLAVEGGGQVKAELVSVGQSGEQSLKRTESAALRAGGVIELLAEHVPETRRYALATPALDDRDADLAELFRADLYRSSDHDRVVIGLALSDEVPPVDDHVAFRDRFASYIIAVDPAAAAGVARRLPSPACALLAHRVRHRADRQDQRPGVSGSKPTRLHRHRKSGPFQLGRRGRGRCSADR
jgi:hypothetical protein